MRTEDVLLTAFITHSESPITVTSLGVSESDFTTVLRALVHSRLIEQWYLGIARYEKATAVKEKGRNISRGAAPNVTVLLEK